MSFFEEKRKAKLKNYNLMIEDRQKQIDEIHSELEEINAFDAEFRKNTLVDLINEYDGIYSRLAKLKLAYEKCPAKLPEGCEISKNLYEQQYGDVICERNVFVRKHPEFVKIDENKKTRKQLTTILKNLEDEIKMLKSKADALISKLKKNDNELSF